jgi:hypothetical protein
MTQEEIDKKMEKIFTAILYHINGYQLKDAKKYATQNKGHELWTEIEKILKSKTSTNDKQKQP